MAFPQNPSGMMAGMNPTAGMSEQEVQMTKMVRPSPPQSPDHHADPRPRSNHRWNPASAKQSWQASWVAA